MENAHSRPQMSLFLGHFRSFEVAFFGLRENESGENKVFLNRLEHIHLQKYLKDIF